MIPLCYYRVNSVLSVEFVNHALHTLTLRHVQAHTSTRAYVWTCWGLTPPVNLGPSVFGRPWPQPSKIPRSIEPKCLLHFALLQHLLCSLHPLLQVTPGFWHAAVGQTWRENGVTNLLALTASNLPQTLTTGTASVVSKSGYQQFLPNILEVSGTIQGLGAWDLWTGGGWARQIVLSKGSA